MIRKIKSNKTKVWLIFWSILSIDQRSLAQADDQSSKKSGASWSNARDETLELVAKTLTGDIFWGDVESDVKEERENSFLHFVERTKFAGTSEGLLPAAEFLSATGDAFLLGQNQDLGHFSFGPHGGGQSDDVLPKGEKQEEKSEEEEGEKNPDNAIFYKNAFSKTFNKTESSRQKPFKWMRHDHKKNMRVQPLHLTGASRKILNVMRLCLEEILDEDIQGSFVESGAWRGGNGIWAKMVWDSYVPRRSPKSTPKSKKKRPRPYRHRHTRGVHLFEYNISDVFVYLP